MLVNTYTKDKMWVNMLGESSYLMWDQKDVKIHYIIYIILIRRKEFRHSVFNRIVKLKSLSRVLRYSVERRSSSSW